MLEKIEYSKAIGTNHPAAQYRSDHPEVQAILEAGFWVEDIEGDTVEAHFYGIGKSDITGYDLPQVVQINNKGGEAIVVTFKIKTS